MNASRPARPEHLVTAVIVNWNAGDHLLRCVDSLSSPHGRAPVELIVVDNASRDGSIEAVSRAHPEVRVIANPRNRGLPAANNQGIAEASGDLLLISNPDVEYRPGALDALVDLIDRHPDAAIAIPRLVDEGGSLQTSAGDLPTLREALAGRARAARRHATSGFWWDGWAHDEEREIGRGHEAAYLVRASAISAVGSQDDRFRLDWEGIDWTARLRAAGWTLWFTPQAEVVHHGGVSIRQAQARWVVRSHMGMYRYFAKRARRPVKPLLAALVSTRAAIKLASLAVRGEVYR